MKAVLYLPDGNRRYAKANGVSLNNAYYEGGKTLQLFSEFFLAEGRSKHFIYHSSSSFTPLRTDGSLEAIDEATINTFEDLLRDKFFENSGIAFKVINHARNIPRRLEEMIRELSESAKNGTNGEVIILIAYSLDQDMNRALSEQHQDYDTLRRNLLIPEIDLVIRTTEMRVSGGPVYAMSQAQMMILNKFNPEVKREDLDRLWSEYEKMREYRRSTNPFHMNSM